MSHHRTKEIKNMPNNENDTGWNDDINPLRQGQRHGDAIVDQHQIDDPIAKLEPRREELRPREKDEGFEIVDASGNGRKPTAPRWICHLLGLRHRCAHVLIVGYHSGLGCVFVLQVRNFNKSDSPGQLDISAAGHAIEEASVDGMAIRRTSTCVHGRSGSTRSSGPPCRCFPHSNACGLVEVPNLNSRGIPGG